MVIVVIKFTEDKKRAIEAGNVNIDGLKYDPIKFRDIKRIKKRKNTWIVSVELREGKNRELRRVFGAFGLLVNRLERKEFGPYSLGSLPPGSTAQVALKGPLLRWWKERLSGILDRLNTLRSDPSSPLPKK